MTVKMLMTSRRRPGMTYAEFIEYNLYSHARTTREYPVGIRRYAQSHVQDACYGRKGDPAYGDVVTRDSVSEMYFRDMGEVERTLTDPRALEEGVADGVNYVDGTSLMTMLLVEEELPVRFPGGGGLKVMHFMRAQGGLAREAFVAAWRRAHAQAVDAGGVGDLLRRVTLSTHAPGGEEMVAAMGGGIQMDAVASLRFDLADQGAREFRRYLDALQALADDPVDHSRSFALMTRELVLFDRS